MKSSSIVTKSLACVLALMLVIGNFTGIMPAGRAEGDSTETVFNLQPESFSIDSNALSYSNPQSFTTRKYSGIWLWPLLRNKNVTSYVGGRKAPTEGASTNHHGTDISAVTGSPIYAARSGYITVMSTYFSSMAPGLGNWMLIDHGDGFYTAYGHMSRFASKFCNANGAYVSAGEVIGYVGNTGNSTGSHLHFEIAYNWNGAGYTSDYVSTWRGPWGSNGWEIVDSSPLSQNYVYDINHLNGYSANPTTLQFSCVTYPKTFRINTSYGWALGSGILQSNIELKSIQSFILDSGNGVISRSAVKDISGYYYPLTNLDDYSGTDNGVRFSFIKNPGQYTWRLTATDISGRSITLDMPIMAVASGSTSTATASKSYSADASISSVKLNKSSLTLESGKSATLTATVSPSKATNKSVTWSSSNTAVATVSNGVVKAVSAGTATITCTSVANNSKKATCTVTVNPAASEITGWVYKVNSSLTMRKDASTFSGRVTSIKKGTTITVTRKAKSLAYTWGYCSLNGKSGWVVVDNRWTTLQKMLTTKVAGVSLNNTYLSLKPGSSATLYANVSPSDAPNRNVTWSSSNTSVATVSNGVVKAVGAGTATITCTSAADSSKKATCTITVSSSASTGDNTAKWVYRVQTSYGLNMRSGAGTGYGIVTTLYSPTTITVTRKATANGYTWGYGTSSNGCTGWIVVDNNWTGLVS